MVQYSKHFQQGQRPVSLLQISLILMKTCIASRCLWAVVILKFPLCLTAGFLWLFGIWTHSWSRFFFRLTTCTCQTAQWLGHCWLWLTQTELADWQQTHKSGMATQHSCVHRIALPTNTPHPHKRLQEESRTIPLSPPLPPHINAHALIHTLHTFYLPFTLLLCNNEFSINQQYTAGWAWWVNDGKTAASSAAVSWRHHAQEMLPTRFQETA